MRFPFVNEKGVWKHVAYISWVPESVLLLNWRFSPSSVHKYINDDLHSNVWKNPFSDKQLGESKKRCVLRCRLLQPRNLVETKSVLDCCRISRNFSRKKRSTKKTTTRENEKRKRSFKPFFTFSSFEFSKKQPKKRSSIMKWGKTHAALKNPCRFFSTIEIWLILPVVICLFQGLSHACLRITALQESAHGSLHQT